MLHASSKLGVSIGMLFVGMLVVLFMNWERSALRIDFLDVGQGDAALIQLGSGETILVDGGPDARLAHHLGRLLRLRPRVLDLVILTHPDADHLTGLMEVIRRYDVKAVLTTGLTVDAPEVQPWNMWIKQGASERLLARRGDRWNIGEATITILYPFQPLQGRRIPTNAPQARGGTNDTSVVFKLEYRNQRFLFMGDVSQEIEEQLLALGDDLGAAVLKVGHHGSRFSTSPAFARAVKPQWAVISVGQNTFGQPAQSVIAALTSSGARVFRTDEQGTITVRVGQDGNVNVEESR